MRIAAVAVFIACLAACKSASQNSEALRQGVTDYLTKAGLNVKGMDLALSNAKFDGNKADVTVSFSVKGTTQVAMTKNYHLEQQAGQWTVVGSAGGSEHGQMAPGAPAAGGENPHAGVAMPAAPPSGGGSKMPSPESLPPAGTKK